MSRQTAELAPALAPSGAPADDAAPPEAGSDDPQGDATDSSGTMGGYEPAEVEEGLLGKGGAAGAPRKTPFVVFVFCVIAALANALFGFETAAISTSKLGAAAEFNVSSESPLYGFLAACNAIGATVGASLAGFPQDWLGRRLTLVIACVVYGGAVTVSVTSASFAQLCAGRLITGLAIGLFSSTGPMYISELAPPAIRGSLVTVNQVCICVGILFGFAVGKIFPTTQWRYMLAFALPVAALLLLAFAFVTPFSPRWLVTKGRSDEARGVLLRIRTTRGADDDSEEAAAERSAVDAELASIEKTVQEMATVSRSEVMAQPWVRWAVIVGVTLSFMQQWTGVNTVNAYAPDVLKDAGFSAADSITQSIYIGVVKLAFVIVALVLMDRLGRRLLLLVGTAGMAVSLGCLATALLVHAPPFFTAGSLFLYMAFFEISLGPVMWLMLSELYPLSVRGMAMSIGACARVGWERAGAARGGWGVGVGVVIAPRSPRPSGLRLEGALRVLTPTSAPWSPRPRPLLPPPQAPPRAGCSP